MTEAAVRQLVAQQLERIAATTGATSLGRDDSWFLWLDDAFIAAMWDGPRPPGYEVE